MKRRLISALRVGALVPAIFLVAVSIALGRLAELIGRPGAALLDFAVGTGAPNHVRERLE